MTCLFKQYFIFSKNIKLISHTSQIKGPVLISVSVCRRLLVMFIVIDLHYYNVFCQSNTSSGFSQDNHVYNDSLKPGSQEWQQCTQTAFVFMWCFVLNDVNWWLYYSKLTGNAVWKYRSRIKTKISSWCGRHISLCSRSSTCHEQIKVMGLIPRNTHTGKMHNSNAL